MPDVLFTKDFTLIDLQTRISFLEDTCDELSKIIARQDRYLRDLQDQLKLMYQHIQANQGYAGIAAFDLLADRPPHY